MVKLTAGQWTDIRKGAAPDAPTPFNRGKLKASAPLNQDASAGMADGDPDDIWKQAQLTHIRRFTAALTAALLEQLDRALAPSFNGSLGARYQFASTFAAPASANLPQTRLRLGIQSCQPGSRAGMCFGVRQRADYKHSFSETQLTD
ncbi:MAG: hypothetical protein H7338_23075 [Candidatus Sericytochromatia bacterium]|nr:hypothetical protein [Candidatus Sericytochromatia bacterium]